MIEVACQQGIQSILRMTGVNYRLVDEGLEKEFNEIIDIIEDLTK
jgi:hypothetical protein